ncbi:unnamed protein product [Cunninghamella blakesleeana]
MKSSTKSSSSSINDPMNNKEDDAATLYPESQNTTLVNPSKLQKLLFDKLSESTFNDTKSTLNESDSIEHEDEKTMINENSYRWFVLLGGFLCQFSSIMQDYYDRQVFKGNVDSTQLSFVGTIGFCFTGLMGPVSQILASKIGTKWVMLLGSILMTAGLILASFSDQVWHLYMTQSIIYGIGAAILNIVSMSITPQWFEKRRALAMGVMMSGSGLGGLATPFIMNELNETLGGAWCYRILGMITFVISMIATLLIKDKKQAAEKMIQFKDIIDLSVCKDSKFIIWVVAGNLSMMGYYIPAFYLPSHATKLGFKPAQGSSLVAVFSAVNIVGRVISGYIGDQVGVVNINILCLLVCGMSSFFIWTFAASYTSLLLFIILYGFMSGAVFSLLAPVIVAITGIEKYPSGISLYLLFLTAARLGPSIAGAIQTATNKNSFFSQQMFTGFALVLSALVTIILKFKLHRGVFGKI